MVSSRSRRQKPGAGDRGRTGAFADVPDIVRMAMPAFLIVFVLSFSSTVGAVSPPVHAEHFRSRSADAPQRDARLADDLTMLVLLVIGAPRHCEVSCWRGSADGGTRRCGRRSWQSPSTRRAGPPQHVRRRAGPRDGPRFRGIWRGAPVFRRAVDAALPRRDRTHPSASGPHRGRRRSRSGRAGDPHGRGSRALQSNVADEASRGSGLP